MQKQCVIVGGGVIGLTMAIELRHSGYFVRVVDRREAGQESSWAAGGILSPMYPWQYGNEITLLYRWSADVFPDYVDWVTQATGEGTGYRKCGILIWDTHEKGQALQWAQEHGIRAELIPASVVEKEEPELRLLNDHALWMPDVATIRPPWWMKALRAYAEQLSVEIVEGQAVTALDLKGGKVRGVDVSGQSMEADSIVIASGAWSQPFLDETGVAARVEPVRGQILFYKTQKGLLGRMLKWKQKYLVPRLDGHVLAGSTVEYVGFNKETTQEAVDMIHQAAVEMMPVLKDCPISHRWAGLRPGIPDSIPLIGPHPEIEGLYFNTGHFRNGMVCSLASARLLADMMTGRPPILEPAPYRPIKK